jgi:hypothetical protein
MSPRLITIVPRLSVKQAAGQQLSKLHPAFWLARMEELRCAKQQYSVRGLLEAQRLGKEFG